MDSTDSSSVRTVRRHTPQNIKARELIEMEKAVQTLFNEGFLTKIECRMIASARELNGKKVALYNIIVSNYQQDPMRMNIMEMLKILASKIQEELDTNTELSNFGVKQEIIVNPLNEAGKNPLLINTVIDNVYKFLPLNEIKKCRRVNHQWNTIAEPFLRKKGLIHFKPETLKPLDFIHSQEFSLPDLPFTDFKFSNPGKTIWRPSEIQHFFDKWGQNIKSVEFRDILLNKKMGTPKYQNITSWITKAKNLNKLIMRGGLEFSDGLGIALDALSVVESISLAKCTIICPGEGNSCLISPREIHLEEVYFLKKGKWIDKICFNDYIDFSDCFKIDLRKTFKRDMAVDMSRLVLNAESVHLDGISVRNWGGARGKVDSLFLSNVRLIERNNLEIKELTLYSGTVDMSVIPHTIEKLRFSGNIEMICDYSLQLMNLKFFGLRQVSQLNLNMISRFACCANLKEVQLEGPSSRQRLSLNLDVGQIPMSVKKLKIKNVKINTSGLHKRQLDKLIIEQSNFENFFQDVTELLSKKILTLNVLVIACLDVSNLKITDFIRFVKSIMGKNKTIGKLVVGVVGDVCLNKNRKFEGSLLSHNVNEESNYYQFTNRFGWSITPEEFEAFTNIGY